RTKRARGQRTEDRKEQQTRCCLFCPLSSVLWLSAYSAADSAFAFFSRAPFLLEAALGAPLAPVPASATFCLRSRSRVALPTRSLGAAAGRPRGGRRAPPAAPRRSASPRPWRSSAS